MGELILGFIAMVFLINIIMSFRGKSGWQKLYEEGEITKEEIEKLPRYSWL